MRRASATDSSAADLARHAGPVVRRLTGLVFPESRRDVFAAAIARGVRRSGAGDLAGYLETLEADAALLDDLVAEITVGETYFFRDPAQFGVIRSEILPALARAHPDRPLRVWSAGCASGEEAYTLAILLLEEGRSSATVLGTDLSGAALARARGARYGQWSLRGVLPEVVATYFREVGGALEVVPEARRAVQFRHHNLAADSYPSLASSIWGFDLILCRNVLIYFDAHVVAQVVPRLIASLAAGGWLVMGASDPPLAAVAPCTTVVTTAGLVYRPPRELLPRSVIPMPAPPEIGSAAPWPRRVGYPPEIPPPPPPPPPVPAEERGREAGLDEALSAYAAGDYHRAATMAAALTLTPDADLAAWVVLVRAHANMGELELAGRACSAALDRHGSSMELAYLHGLLLSEAGCRDAAVAALRHAVYLDRGSAVIHLALAGALLASGDPEGAGRALKNAERLLERMTPEALVPASDGEKAGRLLQLARVQLALLTGGTA